MLRFVQRDFHQTVSIELAASDFGNEDESSLSDPRRVMGESEHPCFATYLMLQAAL